MKTRQPHLAKDRLMALLSLAAQPRSSLSQACLSDEQLAQFLSDELSRSQRKQCLKHLRQCPSCYQRWQENAAALTTLSEDVSLKPQRPAIGWQFLWFPLSSALALGMALLFVVTLLLPQSLAEKIDADYRFLHQSHTAAVSMTLTTEMQPWIRSGEPLGFSASDQPSIAAKAFTDGLLAGQQSLRSLSFVHKSMEWEGTLWSIYYQLGRWSILLWTATQFNYEISADFWYKQQQVLQLLREKLEASQDRSSEKSLFVSSLSPIEEVLMQLPDADKPHLYERLARQLKFMMESLAWKHTI